MTAIEKIGFVGIGRMGNPMARHLVEAGFKVTVFDTNRAVVDDFVAAQGAASAATLKAMAESVDAVITMLPTSDIVREVVGGDDADCLLHGLSPGKVVIDMSTSNPTHTRQLGEALSPLGVAVVDAPVAGGVVFAEDGSLTIMTGGDAETVARCQPLFDAMGGEIIHCGALGAAHAIKALNNYVNATGLIAAIEALVIGRKFGVETDTIIKALLSATTGRNNPIEKKVIPHILTGKFATGMAAGLIAKDVRIAVDTAAAIGAAAPLAERCADLWKQAADEYGFDIDQSEVVRLWEDASGVSLKDGS